MTGAVIVNERTFTKLKTAHASIIDISKYNKKAAFYNAAFLLVCLYVNPVVFLRKFNGAIHPFRVE